MPTAIESLRTKLDDVLARAEEITSQDDFDPKNPGYVALREEADSLALSYSEAVAWQNRRAETDKVGASLRRAESDNRKDRERPAVQLSPGELFVRSEHFQRYAASGSTPRFTIENAERYLTRALPMDTTAWADVIQPPPPRDITAPLAPTPLLDLIPAIPWGSDVVTYVVWAKVAGGAANVLEGVAKPSGEWAPTGTSDQMKKIAVYTQATRELLENGPAVRSKIDTLLTNDVRRQGEANAAAALTAATLPTADGAGDLLAGIRVGVGTVQAAGYQPNAVLLNPADWANLDISVFSATLNGPTVGSSFWGLRPVASPAQPAGTATVGDFSSGMERYIRTAIQVYISDSHANTFVENVFTILAETRELSAVVRPSALCEVTAGTAPIARTARKSE